VLGAAKRGGPDEAQRDVVMHRAGKEKALLRRAGDLLARPHLVAEREGPLVEQDRARRLRAHAQQLRDRALA
jgi:hypothetical protein